MVGYTDLQDIKCDYLCVLYRYMFVYLVCIFASVILSKNISILEFCWSEPLLEQVHFVVCLWNFVKLKQLLIHIISFMQNEI